MSIFSVPCVGTSGILIAVSCQSGHLAKITVRRPNGFVSISRLVTSSQFVWRPNQRLKLAGALVLKEAVVACPGGHGTFVHWSCAGRRVARSLRTVR